MIRGFENGTIWSNCLEQLGEKLARIRSNPPRSSSLHRSLARGIRVNEDMDDFEGSWRLPGARFPRLKESVLALT